MEKLYNGPTRLTKLHDELIAAGITPTLVESDATSLAPIGTFVHIIAPQAVAAVDAVVAAHNPNTPGVAEVQVTADLADIAAFPTRGQVIAALAQIDADLTTLGGAVTLAQAGPILRRTVINQRAIIRALAVWVRRQGGA